MDGCDMGHSLRALCYPADVMQASASVRSLVVHLRGSADSVACSSITAVTRRYRPNHGSTDTARLPRPTGHGLLERGEFVLSFMSVAHLRAANQ